MSSGGEEQVEEENCWGDVFCPDCKNHVTYHFGSQESVICEWVWKEKGCGKVLVERERPVDLNHINARNAALCVIGLIQFRGLWPGLGKDLGRLIGKFIYETRADPCWNFGGAYEYGGWELKLTTSRRRFVEQPGEFYKCLKCGEQTYIYTDRRRWPFGRVKCTACQTIMCSVRGDDDPPGSSQWFVKVKKEQPRKPEILDNGPEGDNE